ncbi:hypothetical protein MMC27_001057 [Xylographa pallens]|nr:hypothetical protein [Xylographa pallens]
MSSASQVQSEPSASKRKRTAGSDTGQDSTKRKNPERVYLVLHETEDPYTPLSHEIIGAYISLQDANAIAFDFWRKHYGHYNKLFEEIEQGSQTLDKGMILYGGGGNDGTMHILCIDSKDIGDGPYMKLQQMDDPKMINTYKYGEHGISDKRYREHEYSCGTLMLTMTSLLTRRDPAAITALTKNQCKEQRKQAKARELITSSNTDKATLKDAQAPAQA